MTNRRNPSIFLVVALMLTGLGGCATPHSPLSATCPMTGQKVMTIIRLYFGRDIAGREPVSDEEWSGFARTVLTPQFPDGLTVYRGSGQWLDSGTRKVIREDNIVVEIAVAAGSDVSRRIDLVIEAYKRQFHQEAVGVITESACARF